MIIVSSTRMYRSREELLSEVTSASVVAIDSESDGERLLGLAIAVSPDTAFYFTIGDPDIPLQFLSSVPSVFHNVLWDVPLLYDTLHIDIQYIFDTMLAAQSCGYHAALGDLSVPFNFSHRHITDLLYDDTGRKIKVKGEGKKSRDLTLGEVPVQELAPICCGHAQATYKIWEALKDKVPKSYTLDMEILPLVMDMHKRGIRVDTELAQERHTKLKSEISYLRMLCDGMGFNPASPKQIGLALAHDGFMTYFTKSGNMVTDEEAMRPLMDETPIVPLVLRFREKSYLDSHYIKPLTTIDRWYPRYHIVRTGRFASSPQIQNIPEGERDLYLPNVGDFFWDADAHQIEPVLMAYLSGDKQMIADVSTGDIYKPIAYRLHLDRYTTKQLVLACSYEASAAKLAEMTKGRIDQVGAAQMIDGYYERYHRFKEWKGEVREQAARDGYVLTLLGRKRTLESMMEGEEYDYDPLLKAVNTIVQGSGADILKLGMKRVMDRKVSLTCHDEIAISTAADIPADILDNLCNVPVTWNIKTGENWGELK